jgi:polygalacturonase
MGKPDEDITITNCTMLHGHAAVAIGSEMSGGVRNVAVSNCVFHGTDRGVRMKTQRGRGGLVEGITFSNIVMQDVGEAINIVLYYSGGSKVDDAAPVDEGTPRFRDILISNITARGSKSAGQIVGLKEMPIEGVTFSNVRLQAEKGLKIHNARDIVLHDVELAIAAGEPLTVTASDGVDRARVRIRQVGR